jgi:hypothetical protein
MERRKEAKMTVTIKTTQYAFSHGKEPRGTGRWMFECREYGKPAETLSAYGTYTEAKKAVVAMLKERGAKYPTIIVLP